MFTNTAVHKMRRLSLRICNRRMVIWLAFSGFICLCGVESSTVRAESADNSQTTQQENLSPSSRCWSQILAGKPEDARASCEQAISLDMNYASAVNLGHTYLLKGDRVISWEWYKKSVLLIDDEETLRQGPLADFDIFLKNGWQPELSKEAQAWFKEQGTQWFVRIAPIDTLRKQADSASLVKDYTKAAALLEECLLLANELDISEHRYTGDLLNGLASLYQTLGQYDKALPLYQRSLAIREKVLGPEHESTASSLINLASLYETMGQHDKALPLCQRAQPIIERVLGPEGKAAATNLNTLARIYQTLGQYDKALLLYQRGLAIREKILGPEHESIAAILDNLAVVYLKMGQYEQVMPLYRRAGAIREKKVLESVISLNNLAVSAKTQGQYEQALSLYQRALTMSEKVQGPEHESTAAILSNLASLYQDLGQYEEALPFCQRALAIREKVLGPENEQTATSLNNLARIYHDLGQHEQALPLYQRALAINEKIMSPEHEDTAAILNNLAGLYTDLGQYEKALPLHQRSLVILEKVLGPDHKDTAATLNNLAALYYETGLRDRALLFMVRAYRITCITGDPQAAIHSQRNLMVMHAKERPSVAIFYGKQAVNTIQGVRQMNAKLAKTLQESFLKQHEGVYERLSSLLVDSGRLSEAQQVLAMLKEEEQHDFVSRDVTAEVGDTRASYTATEGDWQQRFQDISGRLMALGVEYRTLQKQMEQGALSDADDKRLQAISADLDVAERSFNQTFDELQTAFKVAKTERRLELELKQLDESLSGVVGDLGEGTALVHTIVLEDGLRLILTSGETRKAYKVEVTEKDINQAVHQLLQALRDPRGDPRPGAKALYGWLVQPLEADLSQLQPRILMFSLDGVLRYVPMAALYDGQQYLAERYGVALYTTVGRENLKDEPKANWRVAGMGVSKAHVGFKALSAVEDELNGIVRSDQDDTGVLPGSIALDQDFTLETIRQELNRKSSVVHLASHFSLNPGTEQESFLLLGDGTHLSLAELRKGRYPFGAVDLVTLSACDTATTGGKGSEVEGMAGIVQKKGAKSVLATLWPVADSSTSQFMQYFYRLREQDKLSKAEALRQTQLAMLSGELGGPGDKGKRGGGLRDQQGLPISKGPAFAHAAGSPWAHPYYWAPFVLMGNWR